MNPLRNLYAANFAALFFTTLSIYLVDHPEISGFGFSRKGLRGYDMLLKSTHLLVLPASILVRRWFQHIQIDKFLNPLLWFQAFVMLGQAYAIHTKNFVVYLVAVALCNFNYSFLDLILDQLSASINCSSNQAYRAGGAITAVGLALGVAHMSTAKVYCGSCAILAIHLLNQIDHYDFPQLTDKKRTSKKVDATTAFLVFLTVVMTSLSDGIMDATAKVILDGAKNKNPIIVRYICLMIGYGLSHPDYVQYMPKLTINKTCRALAVAVMLYRNILLYNFEEAVVWLGLTCAFGVQSIADIAAGTIFKNDVEQENRECLLHGKGKGKLPGWIVNFMAEQMSPILKTLLSSLFYILSTTGGFNRQFWIGISVITLIFSSLTTTWIQYHNKKSDVKTD